MSTLLLENITRETVVVQVIGLVDLSVLVADIVRLGRVVEWLVYERAKFYIEYPCAAADAAVGI